MAEWTGIGSLPHTDADEAVRFVAAVSPRIPFWPQLPGRHPSEQMSEQALGRLRFSRRSDADALFLKACQRAEAKLDPDSAAGFFAFERALQAGLFPRARMVKGQLPGPLTLAAHLGSRGNDPVFDLDSGGVLCGWIERLAGWQVERLSRSRLPVVLFLDEPVLQRRYPPAVLALLQRAVEAVRRAGAGAGLHCCGEGHPELLDHVRPDLLSWDCSHDEFVDAGRLHRFLARGGIPVFGLVPTLEDDADAAGRSPEVIWQVLQNRLQISPEIARRSWVTPACGLAGLSMVEAADRMERARRLAACV